MKSALLRTGSNPIQNLNRSASGSLTTNDNIPYSPSITFRPNKTNGFSGIRRSNSDTDMFRSECTISRIGRVGSVSYPDMGMIVEEGLTEGSNNIGFGNGRGNHNIGGGNKKGGKNNDSNNNNNYNNEKSKLKEYYLDMLKSNPCDSLLLRNYGKYLHEVEKNAEKAEEYYGRAILASPGDGELLSLYANLIWETQRDYVRARSYFDQALHASPHDSTVLGSHAHFLWETEDNEEEEESEGINKQGNVVVPAMVGAY